MDINNTLKTDLRRQYLKEWKDNVDAIFTPEFYRISHTKETFHNSDYVKFLCEYEYKDELSRTVAYELQLQLDTCRAKKDTIK